MSRKSVVLLGLFIFSLATLLTAYAQGFGPLLGYRFISGLGEAIQATALIAIGTSHFHKHRALVTGTISSFYGIGTFLGPMSTVALLKAYDWKQPFVVFGLAGIVGMVAVWLVVKPWFSESKANESAGVKTGDSAARGTNETIWNPTTLTLALAAICAGVAVFGLFGLFPTYLRGALNFTPGQAATVMSAIGIGGFVAPLCGWFGDRFGYQRALCWALPLAAVSGGLAFTELNRSVFWHVVDAAIYGISILSLLYSNMSAIIIDSMAPSKTAHGSGLFIASYYIPAAFAGYLLAELKEAFGWTVAGLIQTSGFAVLSLVLVLIAGVLRRRAMSSHVGVTLGAHSAQL
jgi:MFS family permease